MALAVTNKQAWEDISVDKTYDAGSGTERVLIVIVGIAFADANLINGVTYNGVAMTAAAASQIDVYTWAAVRIFYMLNPPSGSNTLAFDTGDDTVAQAMACVITGADTSAVGAASGATADSTSASVTVAQSAAGNLLIGGVTNGNDVATITATGGSTVEQLNATAFWFRFALISKPTTGAGTLAIATTNTADGWAIMALEVRAAGATPTNTGQFFAML